MNNRFFIICCFPVLVPEHKMNLFIKTENFEFPSSKTIASAISKMLLLKEDLEPASVQILNTQEISKEDFTNLVLSLNQQKPNLIKT